VATGMVMGKRNDVSVKIDAEVYRMVRTVAAWRGVSVAELLSDVVAPVIRKELKKMNREADAQADSGEEGD
jgi:hypothetical protein